MNEWFRWIILALLSGAFFTPLAGAQIEKADEHFVKSELGPALNEYIRLADAEPANARACIRVAQIMMMANELERAQAYVRRAVAADPESSRAALLIMGEAHRRAGEYELAADVYRQLENSTRANLYASFAGREPYEIVGDGDQTTLAFVESEPIPLVWVQVNGGEPILCAIDTSEAELVLNTGRALECRVETFGQLEFESAGGEPIVRTMGRADSVILGGFEVRNVPVSIGSTKAQSDLFDDRLVNGVIGTSLLSQFRFTMDYPNERLVLEEPSVRRQRTDGEAVARFMIVGDRHLVTAGDVNRRGPFFLAIELGTPDVEFAPSPWLMSLINPTWTDEERPLGQVILARVIKTDVNATPAAFDPSLESRFGFRIHGAVADDYFRDHVITFDWEAMELITHKCESENE